ncbi:hypothetical protein TorRG33x02_116380 [Trema orientale]|uniref:Uncharacterized protein n=1 Tax=Trema orientale TaxID=63057 RepID=A0A2P5F428_TREOI|nr:hypothetical protein TorRG33x02_116380 [Trema orientale]
MGFDDHAQIFRLPGMRIIWMRIGIHDYADANYPESRRTILIISENFFFAVE